MVNVKGIECSLFNGGIKDLLIFLSNEPFAIYISKCTKIDNKDMIMPKSSYDFCVSPYGLRELVKASIWELVLYLYPLETDFQPIKTYDDFIRSSCVCCLIFYDCGLLEIYVKDALFRDKLYEALLSFQARDIQLITRDMDANLLSL